MPKYKLAGLTPEIVTPEIGDLFARFTQEGVILAGVNALGTTAGAAEGLGQDRGEEFPRIPLALGEHTVIGPPILLLLVQPLQGAGDGFGVLATQQAQAQINELGAWSGVGQSQGSQGQLVADPIKEGTVHDLGEGRLRRSKVLGAVRVKRF